MRSNEKNPCHRRGEEEDLVQISMPPWSLPRRRKEPRPQDGGDAPDLHPSSSNFIFRPTRQEEAERQLLHVVDNPQRRIIPRLPSDIQRARKPAEEALQLSRRRECQTVERTPVAR